MIFPWSGVSGQALSGIPENRENINSSGVIIHVDPRIDRMIERLIAANKGKQGVDGYRIQIFFNSGPEARDEANRLKAKILSDYPGVPVYIIFQSPFYKVRIGDFRTKNDALGTYYSLKRKFPSAYIVKDIIRLPDLRNK